MRGGQEASGQRRGNSRQGDDLSNHTDRGDLLVGMVSVDMLSSDLVIRLDTLGFGWVVENERVSVRWPFLYSPNRVNPNEWSCDKQPIHFAVCHSFQKRGPFIFRATCATIPFIRMHTPGPVQLAPLSDDPPRAHSMTGTTYDDSKRLIADSYNAIGPKYHAWAAPRPTSDRTAYIERLAKLLPRGSRILELGCGAGVPATKQCVELGFQVVGVDVSPSLIEIARREIPGAEFHVSDMLSFASSSASPRSFDCVMIFYALWHLPPVETGASTEKVRGSAFEAWRLLVVQSDDCEWGV